MNRLLEDEKRLQGHARCTNGWILPKAILVILAVVLVATTIAKFRSSDNKIEPGEASKTSTAVLVKKLPRQPDQSRVVVDVEADAQTQVVMRSETVEKLEPLPPQEGLGRDIPTRPDSPEQPELEKLIDWMVRKRSPKY